MPVTVECELKPSYKRWLYPLVPWSAGAFLGYQLSVSIWLLLLWLAAGLAFVAMVRSDIMPSRFRVVGHEVMLWQQDQPKAWRWTGEGRLSHAFVEWQLYDEDQLTLDLRIWKDSVSEPSWRALNMAFRVNQTGARQASE